MSIKQIISLSIILISFLIITISVLGYRYIRNVDDNIDRITIGNEQEVIQTSQITVNLVKLNLLIEKLAALKQPSAEMQEIHYDIITNLQQIHTAYAGWFNARKFESSYRSRVKEVRVEEFEQDEHTKLYNLFLDVEKLVSEIFTQQAINNSEMLATIHDNINLLIENILSVNTRAQVKYQSETTKIKNDLKYYGALNLFTLFIVLLSVFILSAYILRYILSNLNRFTKTIYEIAGGNLQAKVNIVNNNEFGLLAHSFNNMTFELSKTKESINHIINTMPNMLFVTNDELVIQKVNIATVNKLKINESDIIGKPLDIFIVNKEIIFELKEIKDKSIITKKITLRSHRDTIPVIFSSSRMTPTNNERLLIHMAHDISQLKLAEDKLMVASRMAGMTDVATSTLHNVGNILSSVMTSIGLIEDKINLMSIDDLPKVVKLLEENKDNLTEYLTVNQRGKAIPDYLQALYNVWSSEKTNVINEIELLKKNANYIIKIITAQQSMSVTSNISEEINVTNLVDDAIDINRTSERRLVIKIKKHYAAIKPVITDKIKFMQVITNLIKNSFDSLLECDKEVKNLTVNIEGVDEDYFKVEVIDNGVGIPRENLTKVFNFGFTTKKYGHGFGLHSNAISVNELGGKLEVHSEGVDQGATFTIILPYQKIGIKVHSD